VAAARYKKDPEPLLGHRTYFQVPGNAAPGTYFFLPWVQFVQGNSTTTYQPRVGATLAIK
jgi:hypothetical protein